jgi:cell division protein FtsI (penicillin-binding protein 3)
MTGTAHSPAYQFRAAAAVDSRTARRDDTLLLDGNAKRAIEIGRSRLLFGAALFTLAFFVIAARLVTVSLLSDGAEPRLSVLTPQGAQPERGEIHDRNGVVLATNLVTASLYVNPQQVIDIEEAATKISQALPDVDPIDLLEKLTSDRSFVWVKRGLTPRQHEAVNRLGLPGFYFQREERRVYPQGSLTAHVVGFADVDNRGLSGIEQSFDETLRQGGRPVTLSIDLRIQNILREELGKAVADFTAIGGGAVLLDIRTGEILGMVSLPDFDPNDAGIASEESRFNRNALGVYEMGSTFKIFNTAMALDAGIVSLNDGFDARRPIHIGGHTISDFKPKNRWLTVPEIFMYSSNIGSAKMAEQAGTERQQLFMNRLGFFKQVPLELPERGKPMYPSDWKPINTMTIAYGHGLAVTPLHLVSGVAAVVNGGLLRPMTLMKRDSDDPAPGRRIIREETSEKMRQLLRLVVQGGTGKFADVAGYIVGGKTGTADKQKGRGYSEDSRVASFVGAFPMNDPRYAFLIMVDEPKPNEHSHGYATGGWVAAPAVHNIVERVAPLVGLPRVLETEAAEVNDLFVTVSAAD